MRRLLLPAVRIGAWIMMTENIFTCRYRSPLGSIILAGDGESLTGLWFAGQKYAPEISGTAVSGLPVFVQTVRWLDTYFSGKAPDFTPPISLQTTLFRRTVCEIMLTIPYGQTVTYGGIAKMLAEQRGMQMSAQAVGGAVGYNPICIIVPCHRVVGANGNLTGYGGGIMRKQALLTLEGVDMSVFYIP